MKRNRSSLTWVIGLLLVLAMLAGCAAPAAAPGGEAAPAEGGEAAAPAAEGGKTKIVWWTEQIQPEQEEAFREAFVVPFNAANPDIELEIVFQESINDIMRTAMQAGEGPDIVQTPGPGYLLEYQDAGLILPLSDYADQYGWKDEILPWAYASGTLGGELYGLPLTYESMILLYNKQVFEELGLTPPTNRLEFEEVAQKLQDAGLLAISYGNVGWQPTNEHIAGMWLNAYAGPDAVYEALTGARPWTDPLFVGAIDMLREDMVDRGYFSGGLEEYYSFDWDTEFSTLAAGKAGMMTVGSWGFDGAANFFTDNPDGWDWAMMPSLREGVPQGYDLAIGSTVSINAASPNPDAAARVLDFFFNDPARAAKVAQIFNFGEFVVPIEFGAEDIPSDVDPRITRYLTDFAKVTGEGNYGYTTWTFWPAAAETQFWTDIEMVWSGEMSTDEYLAKHQELWEKARTDNAVPPIPER